MVLMKVISFCMLVHISSCQLTVNVKDKGGDVLQENIYANTTTDTITLDFTKFDGTFVTQFIDFANEIQIFKAIVLGEVERGKSGYQVMCFVTRFIKNEFISSDAMSKLRQKKPGAVRNPEEDKGEENVQLDLMIDLSHSHVLSPHIADVCKEATDATYVRDNDLKVLSRSLDKDYSILLGATKRSPLYRMQRCSEQQEMWRPCTCHYHMCIGWYPCGLKYCKGKDSSGKVVSYRCGIKTCRKCRLFEYYARQKHMCIWDENIDNKSPEQPNKDQLDSNVAAVNNMDNNMNMQQNVINNGINENNGAVNNVGINDNNNVPVNNLNMNQNINNIGINDNNNNVAVNNINMNQNINNINDNNIAVNINVKPKGNNILLNDDRIVNNVAINNNINLKQDNINVVNREENILNDNVNQINLNNQAPQQKDNGLL